MLSAGAADPHKTCLRLYTPAATVEIDYAHLIAGSRAYASHFSSRGIQRGDVIAIALKHSASLYYAFFGAMLAGAVPSIMPYPNPKQDVARYWDSHLELFAKTNIGVFLTYAENLEAAHAAMNAGSVLLLDDGDIDLSPEARFELHDPSGSETALLQHTSGTTGLKKGVMLSHEVILRQLDDYARALDFSPADVVVSWLPLYHDMGLMTSLLMPLLFGASIVAMDPFEWVVRPAVLFDLIEKFKGTLAWLPNFAFAHLERNSRGANWKLGSLRALVNCSEPCKAQTFDAFGARFSASGVTDDKLQVCYAMAETVFACTQTKLGKSVRRLSVDREALQQRHLIEVRAIAAPVELLSCGEALPGAEIEIAGADGATLAEGMVGEVVIGGGYLFSGYYHRPEATQKKLRSGKYRTGDLGFKWAGDLFITGRSDDLIIAYGRNYYAHEIEASLGGVPGIIPGRAVALGVLNEAGTTQDAVVIAERIEDMPAESIRLSIKSRVFNDLGLVLGRVVLVERGWLRKTTSGKISRSENLQKFLGTTNYSGEIPLHGNKMKSDQNAIMSRVAQIVGETFHIDASSVTRETFSEQVDGWDSVSYTELLIRLEDEFGVEIPTDRAWELQNVGELADVICSLRDAR